VKQLLLSVSRETAPTNPSTVLFHVKLLDQLLSLFHVKRLLGQNSYYSTTPSVSRETAARSGRLLCDSPIKAEPSSNKIPCYNKEALVQAKQLQDK
jgi:hypothetical protein